MEEWDVEFLSLNKCIKNTYTNGVIFIENKLNTSISTLKSTGNNPALPDRMKDRKGKDKERKLDRTCHSCGEQDWGKGEISVFWLSPSLIWKSNGTEKEHLMLSVEGKMAHLWKTGQSVTYTNSPCHSALYLRLGHVSIGVHKANSWKVGIGDHTWGADCHWLWEGDGR